jgi:hypothetical protein
MSHVMTNLMLVLVTLTARAKVRKDGREGAEASLHLIPLAVFHTLVVNLEG